MVDMSIRTLFLFYFVLQKDTVIEWYISPATTFTEVFH